MLGEVSTEDYVGSFCVAEGRINSISDQREVEAGELTKLPDFTDSHSPLLSSDDGFTQAGPPDMY